CRADHRLAQPLPTPRQGLGVSEPPCARLPTMGFRAPHAQKALPMLSMIPDGLLELCRGVREGLNKSDLAKSGRCFDSGFSSQWALVSKGTEVSLKVGA